jgi:hypothetical protein
MKNLGRKNKGFLKNQSRPPCLYLVFRVSLVSLMVVPDLQISTRFPKGSFAIRLKCKAFELCKDCG